MRAGSFLVAAVVLLNWGKAWPCDDEAAQQTARALFEVAVECADRNDLEGALGGFQDAYAACPHYAVLYNTGQVLIKLHRPLEAADTLRRYLQEGGDEVPPDRRGDVEEQIRLLESLLGTLSITTEPLGALIAVDGTEIGRTPLSEPIRQEAGDHTITASLDGYSPEQRSVSIAAGERLKIFLSLGRKPIPERFGTLEVMTEPSGAMITVDGKEIGRTPLPEPIRQEAGEHTVTASLDGYSRVERSILIVGGRRHEVFLVLPVMHRPPAPSWLRRTLPYLLVGTGVALGGTAVGVYIWKRDAYKEWQAQVAGYEKAPANSYERTTAAVESNRRATWLSHANLAIGTLTIASGALVVLGAGIYYLDHRHPQPATNVTVAWGGGGSVAATWRYSW